MNIYTVAAEFYKYRQLVNDSSWKVSQPLLWGKLLDEAPAIRLRHRALAEDQEEEETDRRLEELSQGTTALERHNRSPGDCTNVLHFTAALVFSTNAKRALSSVLEGAGQLFSVDVDGDEFFIFNCTRLLDACVSDKCIVNYGASSLGGQRPGEISKLVVRQSTLNNEFLFKLCWPTPPANLHTVDYSIIPPPTSIYATQQFVDLVAAQELTGFAFHPAGSVE